ncbi:hypothetical protein V8G54_015371 [Vigna mungo]|uniref:Putative plant transposon protein domain-containing protein n=1 Tax=Vigna mungo TaxID=3915 RepID=A0AAQ3NJ80_VIGMU
MADGVHKKRKASSSTGRRPSPPPPSPPPSPPMTSNQLFSNDEQYERFSAHFFERQIIEGYYLHDVFCVKQVKITIKPSLFHKLTSIPSRGVRYERNLPQEWKDEYNPVTARQMICKPGYEIGGRFLAGRMKFECRLLHYVICRILIPRSRNIAQASENDIMLMWALMNSVEINWGHVIRDTMKRATRDNAQLPYPHLITTFLEHFGVRTETDPFTQVKDKLRIGFDALTSMGYDLNDEGQWIHKDDVRNAEQEEEEEQGHDEPRVGNETHEERQPTPIPDQSSSVTMSELLTQIQDLRMFLGNRLDTIENRVGSVVEQLISFRNEFG